MSSALVSVAKRLPNICRLVKMLLFLFLSFFSFFFKKTLFFALSTCKENCFGDICPPLAIGWSGPSMLEIEGRMVLQLFWVSEILRKSANYIFLPKTLIF